MIDRGYHIRSFNKSLRFNSILSHLPVLYFSSTCVHKTKLTKPRKDAIARRGTYAVHRACREKSDPITAAEDALPSAGHPIREVWETRWHTEYPAEEVEAAKRRFAKS